MLTYQVKPDRTEEFEVLLKEVKAEFENEEGCLAFHTMKRFYTFDKVGPGEAPRELTKIVKCVKYYSWAEFDSKENCGHAMALMFGKYMKMVSRLLIAPFDINSGFEV